MRSRSVSLNKLIFLCLIIFSIIPNVGIKFSTVGFTWTAYRLFVLLSVMVVLFGYTKIRIFYTTFNSKWVIFMVFWFVYGAALLFTGKYSDMHNGFVELLSIFNGLVVIYIMGQFLGAVKNRDRAIKMIYWMLNFMIIMGIVEIITGKHWMTSAYHDRSSSVFLYSNKHQATGLMYNMNDFSAMITCMTAILIDKRFGSKRFLTLAGVLFINLKNDATACTLALVVFVGFIYS